jgi:Tol biopolymer transport system component
MMRSIYRVSVVVSVLAVFPSFRALSQDHSSALGVFEAQSDVGVVTPPGTSAYDPARQFYTITSAGENLWSTTDAFHFVWKKMSGDASLTADMNFPDSSGNPNPHRKTLLMFRQALDADGVYVDAAQHGSGLTALQYRRTKGATTQDIELNLDAQPRRVRLEKRGDTFTMFLSMTGEPLHQAGASIKLHLEEPFYAGIGLCSHNKDVVEKATFANVELKPLTATAAPVEKVLYSTLQTIGIQDNFRSAIVAASDQGHMEAPNWSRDGKTLIFNRDGHIWSIPAKGGKPSMIETGSATKCTGSHGLSPDGKLLAISCSMPDKPETRVYILPSSGGAPRLLTQNPWSYFHSWSPDGKTIAFTRPSHGAGNIYTIPADGGEEKALTTGTGISDDPDYSPDGNYIYFNSDRSGSMQIWRMRPDGTQPEQITNDEYNNWTPHPSPDGKSILILSYDKGVTGHPTNRDIAFRILNVADGKIRTIVNIVGGAGSDNVPNWAPDGIHFAFVSYQMLPAQDNGSTE